MKRLLPVLLCLSLSACFVPHFNDYTQKIRLINPSNLRLTIHEKNYRYVHGDIEVERSFSNLNGKLSKPGFEDKEIKVKSHFTEDSWAEMTFPAPHGFHPAPSITLLPPVATISQTISFATESAVAPIASLGWKGTFLSPFTAICGAVFGFGTGLGNDVRNLVTLSYPRAVFGNPWYEYDKTVDLTKEILTPTPEFEKKCHSKKNTFIGNNDCITCLTEKEVISTEEECHRCSNREWGNFECRLK